MAPRFYFTEHNQQENTASLTDAEAHHLLHVLRLKVGAEVELFDGKGNCWHGAIFKTSRKAAEVNLLNQVQNFNADRREVVLATAPPKGDRFRWLVEKITELGIDKLIPLKTERSVVDPGKGKVDKLVQTMIAACKQCRRNQLMQFESQQTWEACLSEYGESHQIVIAHPQGDPFREAVAQIPTDKPVLIATGPEGGWTDEEVEAAFSTGAMKVGLGENILRIETAAITLASQFA